MNKPLQREITLGDVLTRSEDWVDIEPNKKYQEVTVRLWGKGVTKRRDVSGSEISATSRLKVRSEQFILSRIDARNGAFGLVPDSLDGAIVSNDFPVFTPNPLFLLPSFLNWMSKTRSFIDICKSASEGTTNRVRLKEDRFLKTKVLLPSLSEQRRIVVRIEELAAKIDEARELRRESIKETEDLLIKISIEIIDKLHVKTEPLNLVAEKKTGIAYKAEDFSDSEGIPVVRLKEIGTKSPTVYLRNPEDYQNVWLEEGDIILAKTSFSTGAMCIWSGSKAVLNQNAVMLRARKHMKQKYLYLWLKQQVFRYLKDQLADPNFYPYIREKDLINWQVPVPSMSEQQRIISHLEDIELKLDSLKALQTDTAAKLDALMPAILDRAFRGEL